MITVLRHITTSAPPSGDCEMGKFPLIVKSIQNLEHFVLGGAGIDIREKGLSSEQPT